MVRLDKMIPNIRKILFFAVLLSLPVWINAQTLDEAKDMYLAGDYAGALPVFEDALASKPKDPALNQWVGVCLFHDGQADEAKKYLEFANSKGIVEAPRYLAEIAFGDYDFDAAESYIEKYEKGLKRSKKSMPEEMESFTAKLERAKSMLGRVEKIVVIDSMAVDRNDFFKAFRLSPESGSVNSADVLPSGWDYARPTTVFMPETKETMIWAAPDSVENFVLVSSSRLFDGSWDSPHSIGDVLNENGGDSNYPFMMPDGITLYYANDGEESIGGYDIFITRKMEDGFLQPQNLGMPYNSPYDDYLLAIDEVTGVGWWATDRNQLGDYITIYKFIPSDLRMNYEVDAPDLIEKAKLTSYKSTWEEGEDYGDILAAVNAIDPDAKVVKDDFRFALPGGRIYKHWDDFKSRKARALMEKYMEQVKSNENTKALLKTLRSQYGEGNTSLRDQILKIEKQLEADNGKLQALINDIVRAEG